MKIRIILVLYFVIIQSCSTPLAISPTKLSKNTYNVTVYRDNWGTPHIYGEKDSDVAFGLAYANAEDDFKNMQESLLAGRGTLASVLGREHAPNDYMVGLLEIWDKINKYYESDISPETKLLCESYAAGVNQYIEDHPREAYKGVYPITAKDLIAGFVHKTPLFFDVHLHLGDMFNKKPDEINGVFNYDSQAEALKNLRNTKGSNVFAVSPNRSENNNVKLAINSHQPWDGQYAWYEAHLHSKEGWNMVGGLFPGSPVVLVGHNDNLGWGHTVNDPDIVDIYELEVNPDNKYEYKLDGEWKRFRSKNIPIKVKLLGPISWTFNREALWSDHGPVIVGEHATYAIRYSGYNDIRMIEQWYKMNKASNLDEWVEAMKMQAIPMFNAGYADKDQNIYFIYNAKLPYKNPDFNWRKVLPGNRSDLIWDEFVSFDQLPQVLNPSSGFIQNCNNTPFITTTGKDNPNPENYNYVLGIETHMTNRGLRSMELFGNDNSITSDEFKTYKFDLKYSENSAMATYVNRMLSLNNNGDELFNSGLDVLRKWDFSTDLSNPYATLPVLSFAWFLESDPDSVSDETLLERFKDSINYLKKHYGKIDVVWGKVNRLIRGDVDVGIDGGPDISRAVYGFPDDEGRLKGWAGDAYMMLIEWDSDGNVDSQSIHQYGSNTQHKSSKHYSDQVDLFIKHKMKPVLNKIELIKENLEKSYKPTD